MTQIQLICCVPLPHTLCCSENNFHRLVSISVDPPDQRYPYSIYHHNFNTQTVNTTKTKNTPSAIHTRLRLRSMSRKNWSATTSINKSKKIQPIVAIPIWLPMICHSNPANSSADAIFSGVTRSRFIASLYLVLAWTDGHHDGRPAVVWAVVGWPLSYRGKPLGTRDCPFASARRSHVQWLAVPHSLYFR